MTNKSRRGSSQAVGSSKQPEEKPPRHPPLKNEIERELIEEEDRERALLAPDQEDLWEGVDDVNREGLDGTPTDILTGGLSPGAVSQDLTTGMLPRGGRRGGPTGGDVFGAGAGGAAELDRIPPEAKGVDKPISVDTVETGLDEKVAALNTAEILNEEIVE